MHIDLGGVHVGKAARDVVAAARERPVTRLIDFELGIVGVGRGELEPKLRDFLLQEFDRGVGQNVGMDVDGSRHVFSRMGGAFPEWRRVVRISRRAMQYRRPPWRKTVFLSAAFGYKGRPKSTGLRYTNGRHSGHQIQQRTRAAPSCAEPSCAKPSCAESS